MSTKKIRKAINQLSEKINLDARTKPKKKTKITQKL